MSTSTIPTPASPDVCTVSVLLDGSEITGEFHLLSATVSNELNRIPSATLQFRDGEAASATFGVSNTPHFVPGRIIEIQLGYRSTNERVFKGIITRHGIKLRKSGSVLVVECRDEAVRMTRGNRSRYHTGKKDSDIMEELISLHGLQGDVERTQAPVEEMVQYDSTDWDFLLCRAEASGFVVAVEDGKVVVGPPGIDQSPVVSVAFGSSLLELDAEIDARWQNTGIRATSWNPADQAVLEAEAKEPATTGNGNLTPGTLAEVFGGAAQDIRHGGHLDPTELQAWADGRLLKERLAKVRGRVRIQGFSGVRPGKTMEVQGIGERFEGKVYISGVRHTVGNGNWETDVQFGLSPECFAATYNVQSLPAAGLLPPVSGLQIGVVTQLESDPQGEDRIKVRLPLVSSDDEGVWARIATLDAGDGRGTFFRPELDDEVAVGFLNADPRFPIVLGMCHSSSHAAPEPAADANHRKGYVSRSKMHLIFDDDEKSIRIETQAGNALSLSEQDKSIVIADQNGNQITLEAGGITITSASDLTLKASGSVKVEGASIELKAQTSFKAAGGSSAELSAASTTIKGDAATVVKGGIVQIN